MGELAAELEDTKKELQEATATRDQIKAEIRRELNALPRESETDERERLILLAKYIDGEDWAGIAEIIYGDRADFDDKLDSLIRQCHKLHHKALYELSKIVMEDMK